MTDAQAQPLPVEGRHQLVEALTAGMKPTDEWLIGTEHEKFPFHVDGIRPVEFGGANGIEALLKGLRDADKGYEPVYEGAHLIALKKPSCCGQFAASITLEPGGQFELSGAPLASVHQTAAEIQSHFDDVGPVANPLGIGFLGNGYSPKFSLSDTPRMPKGRYDVMRAYMPQVGGYGLHMMHCTSTVQVNLDFSSEADMVQKFRVGLALQPLVTALFANSVFKDGQLNGYQSFRSEVWKDVDPARCGMLPFVFEPGMSFEAYVDYALHVPMYFVYRRGQYLQTHGASFAAFLEGKVEGLEDEAATLEDWELHLTTLFPEVRLKRFLEMRGADCGPQPYLTALSAFWVGLFYHQSSLDAAYDLIKTFDIEDLLKLRDRVPREGLKAEMGRHQVRTLLREVLMMAEAGLQERAALNEAGQSEAVYIEPLFQIVDEGWSQSDRLIDQFENVWAGAIDQVYKNLAY